MIEPDVAHLLLPAHVPFLRAPPCHFSRANLSVFTDTLIESSERKKAFTHVNPFFFFEPFPPTYRMIRARRISVGRFLAGDHAPFFPYPSAYIFPPSIRFIFSISIDRTFFLLLQDRFTRFYGSLWNGLWFLRRFCSVTGLNVKGF